jgi:Predicted transcriptional regulators
MNHIGNVIRQLRTNAGISQKDLADGICCIKYVSLIERSNRTPSTNMLMKFSQKIGIDIFEYFSFLDCNFPVEVHDFMNKFELFRRKFMFVELIEATNQATRLNDFLTAPWSNEIEINLLLYKTFVEKDFENTIENKNCIVERIGNTQIKPHQVAAIYTLLSISYQQYGNCVMALEWSGMACDIRKELPNSREFKSIIIAIYVVRTVAEYSIGNYKKSIEYGNDLMQYQDEIEAYEWQHLTYLCLAFSYFNDLQMDKAFDLFSKGLQLLTVYHRAYDFVFIKDFPDFNLMLNDQRVDQKLVLCFQEMYRN